jgi:hypothetical protein
MTQTKNVVTQNPIDSIVTNPNMSTSAKIRSLYDAGITRSQIAQMLDKRYQHVRNVLITPIKKS